MISSSLKNKMTFAVFLLVILLMGVTATTTLLYFEKELKKTIASDQFTLLSAATAEIDERVFDALAELDTLADLVTLGMLADPDRAQRLLDAHERTRIFFNNSLFLFSSSGKLLAATPREMNLIGKDYSFRDYFKETVETGEIYVSRPFDSVQKKSHPIVMVAIPVYDAGKKIIAVLGGSIEVREQRYLRHLAALKLGKGGYLSLYDANRTVLMHPDQARLLRQDPPGANRLLDQALEGFEGTRETLTAEGIPVIRSVKRLESTGWVLAISFPTADAYASIHTARKFFVAGGIAATLCSVLLVWLFMRRLTAPLDTFARHIRELPDKQGGDKLVPIVLEDEIGVLAQAFNRLLIDLEEEKQALRENEERYRSLVENINLGISLVDHEFRVVMVNAAAERMFYKSAEDLIGQKCFTKCNDESCLDCPGKTAMESGKPATVERDLDLDDGSRRVMRVSAFPVPGADGRGAGFIEVVEDITQQRKAEEEKKHLELQLRQSQKMEALGTLAGGVAHDFNNILTAITGYCTLIERKSGAESPVRGYLDKLLASTDRAAALTRSLLAYSRKQPHDPQPVDLNAIIGKIDTLLSRLLGEDIELTVRPADGPLTVLADGMQIEQVLMNLAANARDAMPDGGILQITAGRTEIDAEFVKAHGYGLSGEYALITVSDTGCGMDEQIRERIFEPFFTTKEVGRGTGLGLSIAYGIVKQHSGYINVYSEPGKGTTFTIYFPLTDRGEEESPPTTPSRPRGGAETILLIEDDAEIRATLREILEGEGYAVIEAADGEEGIGKFRAHGDEGQLLILDVVMPKKNGKAVYEEIRAIRPDVRAIFISGYTADILSAKGVLQDDLNFVCKPIVINKLLDKVREVLDQ